MATNKAGAKIGVPVVLPIRTGWTAYTPATTAGLGTVGGSSLYWSQDGEDLLIEGRITLGTTTGVEAVLGLPINPATNTVFTMGVQRGNGIALIVGEWKYATTVNPSQKTGTLIGQSGYGGIRFSYNDVNSSASALAAQIGTNIWSSANPGLNLFINARIPCAEFAGMGTQAYGSGLATGSKAGLIVQTDEVELTITGTNLSMGRCVVVAKQYASGRWRLEGNVHVVRGSPSAQTSQTIAIPGVVFKNATGFSQPILAFADSATGNTLRAYTSVNTGNLVIEHASINTTYYLASFNVELESKPTWA